MEPPHGSDTDTVDQRLRDILEALTTLYTQVAELSIARTRNRIVAFSNAQGTVKDRDGVADWHVLDITDDLTRKQAEIRCLQEERDYLRFATSGDSQHAR